MSLRVLLKQRLPGLHRLLVPIYWGAVRPALRPLLEWQLGRSYPRLARDPTWRTAAALAGPAIPLRLAARDRYAGVSRRDADHYAKVGYSALAAIQTVLERAGSGPPQSVLDLPCGHGRVLRMLQAAWPEAALTACDLDTGMVDFCARAFGARPVYSKDSPSQIELEDSFDLIWCGSLLTHLDIERWPAFMSLFHAHLRPGGVLVFTTHGDHVIERIRRGISNYELEPAAIENLLRGHAESGFGFAHYPRSEGYYGISLARPDRVEEQISAFPDLRLVAHLPHGWDDHQDVFGCQRQGGVASRTEP